MSDHSERTLSVGLSSSRDRPHAGFCERLRYHFLGRALERGWDQARDGQCLNCPSESHAMMTVEYARRNVWLPTKCTGVIAGC